jgi:hypothetical protein
MFHVEHISTLRYMTVVSLSDMLKPATPQKKRDGRSEDKHKRPPMIKIVGTVRGRRLLHVA